MNTNLKSRSITSTDQQLITLSSLGVALNIPHQSLPSVPRINKVPRQNLAKSFEISYLQVPHQQQLLSLQQQQQRLLQQHQQVLPRCRQQAKQPALHHHQPAVPRHRQQAKQPALHQHQQLPLRQRQQAQQQALHQHQQALPQQQKRHQQVQLVKYLSYILHLFTFCHFQQQHQRQLPQRHVSEIRYI
ncbi:unnamed protein product [Rotaria sp. Silwood2]|nr:unnamed protein product [Rotaria sp. Silwood2]CAF3135736.1 unnamed protein product [Rotaria sp. Silwood2]CAF3437249.1 unnamed protein product [Rotaria sp. Silwood2]CAF3984042.1 unnamed protein product [Rotaria sp. Silwood2]CAF4343592.1 unnamed protein product [Rotaria sp. Silwood2]